jgi:hypothetical protein
MWPVPHEVSPTKLCTCTAPPPLTSDLYVWLLATAFSSTLKECAMTIAEQETPNCVILPIPF